MKSRATSTPATATSDWRPTATAAPCSCAPNNKQLNKKLANVMLTKEDRLARKRRAAIVAAAILLLAAAAAALYYLEDRNSARFAEARRAAQPFLDQAGECVKQGNFTGAKTQYDSAISVYAAQAAILFSPFRGFDRKAKEEIARLNVLAMDAMNNAQQNRDANSKRSDSDLASAENRFEAKQFNEAQDFYTKVLDNKDSSEKNRLAAKDGLAKVQQQRDAYAQALKRLRSAAAADFNNSVEVEAADKRKLMEELQHYPGFDPSGVELPLLVETDSSGVQVLLDGRPVGAVDLAGGREANTFRYPAVGTHRFEFKKAGFKTVACNPLALNRPVFTLRVEREPAVQLDLKAKLGPDVKFSGEPALENGAFFIGTTEGGLRRGPRGRECGRAQLHARRGRRPEQTGGRAGLPLQKPARRDVHHLLHPLRRLPRPASRGAVLPGSLAHVQGQGEPGAVERAAEPAPTAIPGCGRDGAPHGQKAATPVDCENGQPVAESPLDFTATITSSAITVGTQDLIVAGVREADTADAKLYGYSLLKKTVSHKWNPRPEKVFGLRSKPVLWGDRLAVGGANGNFYFFDPANQSAPATAILLQGAGEFECEPLIVGNRLFAGTVQKDGFWNVDLARHQPLWEFTRPGMGGISAQAAVLDETVYFATDKGRLYALDAAKGALRWSYEVEGGARLLSRPLIHGRRVYVVSAEGKIIGFDE